MSSGPSPDTSIRRPSGFFRSREKSDLVELALSGRSPYEIPFVQPLICLTYDSGRETRLEILARLTRKQSKNSSAGGSRLSRSYSTKKDLTDLRRIETDLSGFRGMDVFAAAAISLDPGMYDCRVVYQRSRQRRGRGRLGVRPEIDRALFPVRFESPFAAAAQTGRGPGISRPREATEDDAGKPAHGPISMLMTGLCWAPIAGSRGSRRIVPARPPSFHVR